jgi:hypothetical protein
LIEDEVPPLLRVSRNDPDHSMGRHDESKC